MNYQPPKILITGAGGFTGQHACVHFSKAGFDVIGVSRKKALTNTGINTEYCDLTDNNQVEKLIEKVNPQYLLHLAGKNHVGQAWIDPINSIEANVMSTAYLINAIRQKNLSCRIVVAGSALQCNPATLSQVTNPYSLSKTLQILIAQSWAVLYNMNIVIAKPANIIGPGLSNGVCSIFAKHITDIEESKSERTLEVNNVKAQRDFIDVRDVVSAYEILLLKGEANEIYEIGSE
ncbi:NAD-dependent epimerase/dehydratase family protein, partial [Cytobacillus firmus]